ncbi:hypothetical protein M6B38_165520 [Iris pallida]|uniref:Uncharacterized protein n=1 Tax=Iris pallida TaxID=29817 RepID=A0AAX6EY31_IRIPA|nr:hypothetical protein M6B38_165520 [Iris pallida]
MFSALRGSQATWMALGHEGGLQSVGTVQFGAKEEMAESCAPYACEHMLIESGGHAGCSSSTLAWRRGRSFLANEFVDWSTAHARRLEDLGSTSTRRGGSASRWRFMHRRDYDDNEEPEGRREEGARKKKGV